MQNEFVQRIKRIEDELLALKTNSKYTQAKPMEYTSVEFPGSGIYKIEYAKSDENILSVVVNTWAAPEEYIQVHARTVNGRYQEVEIYVDPDLVGESLQVTVLSTCEVVGFEKVA